MECDFNAKYNKHFVTVGNFFVFFLHLSASTFRLSSLLVSSTTLSFFFCSLVAFHPGSILDICE